jgi:hypothetical protein
MGPVIVSAPLEPLTVIVSVPAVQFVKVQPDMLSVPAGAMLTTRACAAAVVPVIAVVVAILPVPNWAELKVAVDVPDVLTKVSASTLRKPLTPSEAAALKSIAVPTPARPTCRMSLPPAPLYRSAAETWFVSLTTKRSIWLLPTMVSSPVEPVTVMMSVPEVQVAKVQPDMSSEPPADRLTATAWTWLVPVNRVVFEILPAPNWAALKVAVVVPEVLTKVTRSMLTKPSMPSVAAALRSMAVPVVVPIRSVSASSPPSYRSPAWIWLVAVTISVSVPAPPRIWAVWVVPVKVSAPVEPFTVIVSVPEVQSANVQVERSTEPAAATLTVSAWTAPSVPVMAAAVEILPVPNCVAFSVADDVPEVLTKAMPSTLRKPLTPSAAAVVKSMLVPAPATPTCRMSLPAPPL